MNKIPPIKLLYFRECPNFSLIRNALEELKLPFILILQDDLQRGDSRRGYSSPSIIGPDGELILGTVLNGDECGSCTFLVPEKEHLKRLIYSAVNGS